MTVTADEARAGIDEPRSSTGVLCFGEALWDVTAAGRSPGGAPLNVAACLVQLGVDAKLLSRVGDDDAGRELIARIESSGLSTEHVQIDAELPTGQVYADTSNELAVAYRILEPAAWDRIESAALTNAADPPAQALVYGSLAARAPISRNSLMQLLSRAELRIFDVNMRPPFDSREIIEPLLAQAHWVKLNEAELETIAAWNHARGSRRSKLEALCAQYAVSSACLTMGGEGAIMCVEGTMLSQPAYEVPILDTIGCGDAFLAGWLARMLRGATPAQALRFGCAAGAIAATCAGAAASLDTALIEQLIARG